MHAVQIVPSSTDGVASIDLPRQLDIGPGASGGIVAWLESVGCNRPLIVTDRFLANVGFCRSLIDLIKAQYTSTTVFMAVEPDPNSQTVEQCAASILSGRADAVIAIGGGSTMDTAKAAAVLARLGSDFSLLRSPPSRWIEALPLACIPTTAGTGSEVTRFTVITDLADGAKVVLRGPAYVPAVALIDYRLTMEMPPRLTADVGIDAMTHAIEAFVSRRANLLSDTFALEALRLIGPNLRRVVTHPSDEMAREAMMRGATFAGLAFSSASVALVHGMSRPIGALFHVPHGLSNAMLLPTITAWSAGHALPRYAACARAMGVASANNDDREAVDLLLAELRQINIDLDVPSPTTWGIAPEKWRDAIAVMAEHALASGSPDLNPRTPTSADVAELYAEIFAGNDQ